MAPIDNPEIFWVVGNDTDVGKTTLSTALIRNLNRRGKKTVGFKPHAGVSFVRHIDFMLEFYRRNECRVFGEDALRLAQASPLTTDELVEVIAPSYRVHFPTVRHTVLARVGAKILGNRQFFRSRTTTEFPRRADIARLTEMIGLPFDEAVVLEEGAPRIDLMLHEERARAFGYLRDLGAESMVLEGAGGFLPVWFGGPMPNHVLVVTEDVIHFFPNVSVHVDVQQPNGRVASTRVLLQRLAEVNCRPISSHKYLVESRHRDSVSEKFVDALISKIAG